MSNYKFKVTGGAFPMEIFPDGLNTAGFLNITAVGDEFARFIAPDGTIHDCKKYHQQYREEFKRVCGVYPV